MAKIKDEQTKETQVDEKSLDTQAPSTTDQAPPTVEEKTPELTFDEKVRLSLSRLTKEENEVLLSKFSAYVAQAKNSTSHLSALTTLMWNDLSEIIKSKGLI